MRAATGFTTARLEAPGSSDLLSLHYPMGSGEYDDVTAFQPIGSSHNDDVTRSKPIGSSEYDDVTTSKPIGSSEYDDITTWSDSPIMHESKQNSKVDIFNLIQNMTKTKPKSEMPSSNSTMLKWNNDKYNDLQVSRKYACVFSLHVNWMGFSYCFYFHKF